VDIIGRVGESPGKEQNLELQAESISIVGDCPAEKYPLQKKRHRYDTLLL
jgi:asparaginyl-tRNA synthetase